MGKTGDWSASAAVKREIHDDGRQRIDFRAASIVIATTRGKDQTVSKCRAIWDDGALHVFGRYGKIMEISANRPTRAKGIRGAYRTETELGPAIIRPQCMICAGWWRVAMKSARSLLDGS